MPPDRNSTLLYTFLDGKAIFTHHDVAWSRRTEAVYAQDVTVIADVAMPALDAPASTASRAWIDDTWSR